MLDKPWHDIGLDFINSILEKAKVFFFDRLKIRFNARVQHAHENLEWLLHLMKTLHNIGRFTGTRHMRWWHWAFRLEELSYWGTEKSGLDASFNKV